MRPPSAHQPLANRGRKRSLSGLEQSLPRGGVGDLLVHRDNLRREIALAKQRLEGLKAAINSREKSLVQLEARIALATSPGPAALMSAR